MSPGSPQTMLQHASKRIDRLENLLVQSEAQNRVFATTVELFGQVICGMAFAAGLVGSPGVTERDIEEIEAAMNTAPDNLTEKRIELVRG